MTLRNKNRSETEQIVMIKCVASSLP